MLNQWNLLVGYCDDGRLHIRSASLWPRMPSSTLLLVAARHPKGRGKRDVFHLGEAAKANGLEPYVYLSQVLQGIGSAGTLEKLEMLLPWNMK